MLKFTYLLILYQETKKLVGFNVFWFRKYNSITCISLQIFDLFTRPFSRSSAVCRISKYLSILVKSSLISAGCAVQGIGLHYLLITASTEDYCKIAVLTAREGVTKPDWIDRSNWEESVESQFFIWLRPRSLSFIHEEREKTTIWK